RRSLTTRTDAAGFRPPSTRCPTRRAASWPTASGTCGTRSKSASPLRARAGRRATMVTEPSGEVISGRSSCHACELWFDGLVALGSHVQWHYARLVETEGTPAPGVEARKTLWRVMNAI